MRRILVANPKGGTGKSTLATHIAAWYAWQEKSVMLGDLDRQQSSVRWLALRNRSLPRIGSWEIGDEKIARPPKGTEVMVLDSPAGLSGKALKHALNAVDKVLVPLSASIFDQWAVQDFFDELTDIKAVRKDEIAVATVAMRINARTQAAVELEDFLSKQRLPLIATLRQTQLYVQTLRHGMTLFDLSRSATERDRLQWQPIVDWLQQRGSDRL